VKVGRAATMGSEPDGQLIVGGSRRAGNGRQTLFDPYRSTPVAEVHTASQDDVDAAVELARDGAAAMSRLPGHSRADLLRRAIAGVRARADEVATTVTRQTGKALRDTRREVDRSTYTLRAAATAAVLFRKVALAGGCRAVAVVSGGNVDLSEEECIITNRMMETSIPGVFAAGDVMDDFYRQAITANPGNLTFVERLGDLLLRRNDTAAAAGAFAREAARGVSPDTAYFNAGTSALFGGRMAEAQQWLELPARSLDPDLRFRALFNLGLAALQEARRDPARREELNREATGRFREALLLRPGSFDAKWNLELVQGPLPPPSSGAGGGEGRTPPPPPQTPPQPRPSGGVVSPADAEGILNSVERAEREARSEQARRRRLIRAAVARDW